MKKIKSLLFFIACLLVFFKPLVKGQTIVEGSATTVQSPDNNLIVHFYQKKDNAGNRKMYYHVEYKGKPVILESALDLEQNNQLSEKAMNLKVDQHKDWCENLSVTKIGTIAKDTTWIPVNGENSQVRDHYNEVDISTVKDDNPIYTMDVKIRAYNEGIAIRYFFPENVRGL